MGNCFSLTVTASEEKIQMTMTETNTCLKAPGRMVVRPVLARERELRLGRAGKSPGPNEVTVDEER